MKRKWDVSSEQVRKKCVEEIIARIDEQGSDKFGIIAAEEIINIVLQNLAPDIYNLALNDAAKLVRDKLEDLETGLDLLKTDG